MHSDSEKGIFSKNLDILSKLPKIDKGLGEETCIYICRYRKCKAVSLETTLGYCPDHFVLLYQENQVGIPTAEQVIEFRHKMALQEENECRNVYIGEQERRTAMTRNSDTCRNCREEGCKPGEGHCEKKCTPEGGHCENTHFVLNLRRSDDLIESASPSHDTTRRSSKQNDSQKCILTVCYNQGNRAYNGLCDQCFHILLSAKEVENINQPDQNQHQSVHKDTNPVRTNQPVEFQNGAGLELNLSENWEGLEEVQRSFNEIQIEQTNEPSKEDIVVVPHRTEYLSNSVSDLMGFSLLHSHQQQSIPETESVHSQDKESRLSSSCTYGELRQNTAQQTTTEYESSEHFTLDSQRQENTRLQPESLESSKIHCENQHLTPRPLPLQYASSHCEYLNTIPRPPPPLRYNGSYCEDQHRSPQPPPPLRYASSHCEDENTRERHRLWDFREVRNDQNRAAVSPSRHQTANHQISHIHKWPDATNLSENSSNFKRIVQSIEENSKRNSKKCQSEHCTNFGNSRCRGYCNSCYRTINR